MTTKKSGDKNIDDGRDKNESENVSSDNTTPNDNDIEDQNLINEAKKKLEETDKKNLQQIKEDTLKSRVVISKEIVTRNTSELKPHEINKVLYGDEKVDPSLVKSILEKGQLEPIVITEDNTIISGHRRWLALKHINENKLEMEALKEGSVMNYRPITFIEMSARCVVANFTKEEERILAIIDYNKRRYKRPSQYYQEIKKLREIYDHENDHEMLENIDDYIDWSDLTTKHPKEDPNMSNSDYLKKLKKENKITDDYIIKGKVFQEKKNEIRKNTLERIAGEIGLKRTNVMKLDKIGKMAEDKVDAEGDEVAKKVMQYLDSIEWKVNNGYNIVRLRELQINNQSDGLLYEKINTQLNEVLIDAEEVEDEIYNDNIEANKESEKKAKKKRKFITDRMIKEYQERVKKDTKEKEKRNRPLYNVILIEPDNDIDKFNSNKLNASVNSALFVIAYQENLVNCISLMKKLDYDYVSYYNYNEQLILLGNKTFVQPKTTTGIIKNRKELYEKIRDLYPDEKSFHEVKNKNTPSDKPYKWETPVGRNE